MLCFSISSPGPKNGVLDALNTKCFWSVIQSDIKLLSVFPTSVLRELSRTLQPLPVIFALLRHRTVNHAPTP